MNHSNGKKIISPMLANVNMAYRRTVPYDML